MSAVTNYVNMVITADSVGVQREGFGTMLIPSATATFPERARVYTSTAEIIADGFAADSPEVLAAGAAFGQNPHVPEVMIGRCALPPTQVWQVDVLNVLSSTLYALNVDGEGVTASTASDTSDSSADNDEIVALLVTKLNAVVGKNYTAAATGSVGSQVVTVTATAAGDWFVLESVDPTKLGVRQVHVDPGIATDMAAILLENDDFYWVYSLFNSEPYVTALATWCQSNRKLYVAQSNDTRDLGTSTDTAGVLDVLGAAGRTYCVGDWHHDLAQMAGAALVGNIGARTPGTYTALGKRRAGVTATRLTPTQRANLVARNACFYESAKGVSLTANGTTTAGPSDLRGFIDNVVFLDWLEDDMGSAIFGAIAGADKIDRTDEGLVVIENEIEGSLRRGIANRGIAVLSPDDVGGPSPQVSIPKVADMADLLPRGVRASFSFKLAGAVHEVNPVNGVVVL